MSNKTDTCCVCQETHWQGSDRSHVFVENGLRAERSQAFKTARWKPSRPQLHLSAEKHRQGSRLCFWAAQYLRQNQCPERLVKGLLDRVAGSRKSSLFLISDFFFKKRQSKKILSFNVIIINTKCYYK